MISAFKIFQFLLLVKIATSFYTRPQNDVVLNLNRLALNWIKIGYPFELVKEQNHLARHVSSDHLRNLSSQNQSFTHYWNVNETYFLKTTFNLVSLKVDNKLNESIITLWKFDLSNLEELITHSLLRYLSPNLDYVLVKLENTNKSLNLNNLQTSDFPICLTLTIESKVKILEDQVQNAIMDSTINKEDCQFNKTESTIKCFEQKPKSKLSVLRLGDYWIQFHPETDFIKAERQRQEQQVLIFTYNHAWVIGLAVIGGIIGLFFIGCIVAICYTRRPYRRSGKVYEVESANKKSVKIPKIPDAHPTTKASALTKNKELYY